MHNSSAVTDTFSNPVSDEIKIVKFSCQKKCKLLNNQKTDSFVIY